METFAGWNGHRAGRNAPAERYWRNWYGVRGNGEGGGEGWHPLAVSSIYSANSIMVKRKLHPHYTLLRSAALLRSGGRGKRGERRGRGKGGWGVSRGGRRKGAACSSD